MQTRLCPSCGGENLHTAVSCIHCGMEMRAVGKARPYEVVRNGFGYGIASGGEIRIHGMKLKEAQRIVEILNSLEEGGAGASGGKKSGSSTE